MDTTLAIAALPTLARRIRRAVILVAACCALLLALSAPAFATAAEEGVEESGKLTISDNPHDQFGLALFGIMGVMALGAGANAWSQLKGRRPQADGKIRWR